MGKSQNNYNYILEVLLFFLLSSSERIMNEILQPFFKRKKGKIKKKLFSPSSPTRVDEGLKFGILNCNLILLDVD